MESLELTAKVSLLSFLHTATHQLMHEFPKYLCKGSELGKMSFLILSIYILSIYSMTK